MGFQYISHTVDVGLYDPDSGVWLLPEVEKEAIYTLKINVRVLQKGTFLNTVALVSSQPEDVNRANGITSVSVGVSGRSSETCGYVFN